MNAFDMHVVPDVRSGKHAGWARWLSLLTMGRVSTRGMNTGHVAAKLPKPSEALSYPNPWRGRDSWEILPGPFLLEESCFAELRFAEEALRT